MDCDLFSACVEGSGDWYFLARLCHVKRGIHIITFLYAERGVLHPDGSAGWRDGLEAETGRVVYAEAA